MNRIIDRIETILSAVFFTGMFGSIIVQVFFRYVLQSPLVWPYELSIYCYIFIVFTGAAMAARRDSHIVFDMLYERLSEKTRVVTSLISNLIVIAVFISVFPSSIDFMQMFGSVRSSSLGIPMYMVLASFPAGMGLIVLCLGGRTIGGIRELKRMRKS